MSKEVWFKKRCRRRLTWRRRSNTIQPRGGQAGAGHRLGRAAVVKLSSRINVQWRTSTPVEAAFVALSMYAPWEKPYRITAGNRRYADGAVHRLISEPFSLCESIARAIACVRRVTSTSCTGMGRTGAPTGPLAMRLSLTECEHGGCSSWARPRQVVVMRTRGLTSSCVHATTSPRTVRITPRHPAARLRVRLHDVAGQCRVSALNEPDDWGP